MKYRVLWFIEFALIALLFLVLVLPIQDYAMRQFKEYMENPSPATRKAFEDKSQEESRLRRDIAIFVAAGVLILAVPIDRNRPQNSKGSLS
jgi:hypothetical protein